MGWYSLAEIKKEPRWLLLFLLLGLRALAVIWRLFALVLVLVGFSGRAPADDHERTALIMMAKPEALPYFGQLSENALHAFLSRSVAEGSADQNGIQIIDETLYLQRSIDFGDLRSGNLVKDAVSRYSDEIDVLMLYTVNQTIDVDTQFELARITYQIDIEITGMSSNALLGSQSYTLTSPPGADLSDVCAALTTAAELCRVEDLKAKLAAIKPSLKRVAQASILSEL